MDEEQHHQQLSYLEQDSESGLSSAQDEMRPRFFSSNNNNNNNGSSLLNPSSGVLSAIYGGGSRSIGSNGGGGVVPPAPPLAIPNRISNSSVAASNDGHNVWSENNPSSSDRRRLPLPPPNNNINRSSPSSSSNPNNSNNNNNVRLPSSGSGYELSNGSPNWQNTSNGEDRSSDQIVPPEHDIENNSCCGWSEVELSQNPGMPPSPRSLHAAALLNGVLYVFGGYDGNHRVNTFHAFSFAEKRWSLVLPSTNSAPPPSPRDRHIAVAFGNSLYIHGGFDGTSRVADFWAFDFSTMTWREVLAFQGRAPSARHSHAAAVHNRSLFIFGGYDGSYKSDLHEFNFANSQWTAVPGVGRRPRARYRASLVAHKNSLILFGGHDGTRHLADTLVFDIDTRTWTSLVIEGTPPVPRDSHVSVVHGNSMYVFGGSSGSAMNDLHELQFTSNLLGHARWREVRTSHSDQPRHRFCHVGVVTHDSLYVFGGYDGADRLNDFIKFDFAVYDLSFEVPPSTITSDFKAMINDSTLSDVTFVVEGREIYAHKLMLIRCSYFQSLFLGPMRESKQATIQLEQVRHPIFLAVLEYLYTDQLKIPLSIAMELFEAADLFCIPRLKTMCEKRMLQSITVENAASIFLAADVHSAAALRQKVRKYILSHFEEVSKTSSFEEMGRSNMDLVFEILQNR